MGEDAAAVLRSKRLRATPQRRAILEAFAGGGAEHLSAEEIHARAASRVPGIGRGTVYATVAELTELGLLAAVGNQDPVRYETNVAPHDHFRCRPCLRIIDVALDRPPIAELEARGFLVEDVGVVAEGVCPDCQAFGRGLRDGCRAVVDGVLVPAAALETLSCARHDSQVGPLVIGATTDGIARVACEEHADFAPFAARARSCRGSRAGRERIERLVGWIDRFLAGDREAATDVVDWSLAGDRARAVLESTRRIPWGDRRSYHRLGVDVDAYDCGWFMGTNPLPFVFPCHRVTRGAQVPAEYVGGAALRRTLDGLERP